jgi:hypothetical protein
VHTAAAPDRKITRILLAAGILVAAGSLRALGVLWATDTTLFTKVIAVLGAAYVGGRMAGILTGLDLGLGNPTTSMVIILLNIDFVVLFTGTAGRSHGVGAHRHLPHLLGGDPVAR